MYRGFTDEIFAPDTNTIESTGHAYTSLQQQRVAKVGADIANWFSQKDSSGQIAAAQLPELLGVEEVIGLSRAIDEFGMLPMRRIDISVSLRRPESVRTKDQDYPLTEMQVEELNDHPLTHTRSANAIARALQVGNEEVGRIAHKKDIVPVFKGGQGKGSLKDRKTYSNGLYNLDQIELIKTGLRMLNPPKNSVAMSKIFQVAGVRDDLVLEAMEVFKPTGNQYFNRQLGRSEVYLGGQDAIRVVAIARSLVNRK